MTVAVAGAEDTGTLAQALRKRRVLALGATVTAVLSVTMSSLVAYRHGVVASPLALILAAAAFGVSQLARIRVRLGSDFVLVAWGEVGIFAELCLIPGVWLPAATAVGGALAHLTRLAGVDAARRTRIWYNIASLMTAGGVAAAVTAVMSGYQQPVSVDLDEPTTLLAPLCSVLAYFLVVSVLTSAWVASSTRAPLGRVWLCGIRATRLMFAGHLAVGLIIMAGLGYRWLIVLTPVLWLVHQAYTYQLRGVEERAAWLALADAMRRLNQRGERGVVGAALRGAVELFGSDEVEIVLRYPPGHQRGYRVTASEVAAMPPGSPAPEPTYAGEGFVLDGQVSGGDVELRQLVVGGFDIGELRLRFRGRPRPSSSVLHAFSTFADAVASALHDAMTSSQLQVMAARSAHDAAHDTLTGLSNRTALLVRGRAHLCRLAPDQAVALVLLGLDGFREINETLGRLAGDRLLQVLARRLADLMRADELIGRLGGDEFVIVLTGGPAADVGPATWDYPVQRAQAIAAAFSAPMELSGVTIVAETSAGVVVDVAAGADMTELLRRADIALHQAKGEATRVVRYRATSDSSSVDRLGVLADLRDALAVDDQLTIELQPTVDLTSGVPVAFEAFSRWRHPRRGLIRTGEFADVIEHSDLAKGFSHHTLTLALSVAADWARGGVHLPVAVNLCRRCLLDQRLPEQIVAHLAAIGVPASQLIIEVTETAMAVESDVVKSVVMGLREAGIQISLDDFGTTKASLTILNEFRVDEVKIDRGFVLGMADSPETAAIVRATVDLARELRLRVVAQGVERPQQADALRELGVTAAQGKLFHPPMGIAEATVLVGATGRPEHPGP